MLRGSRWPPGEICGLARLWADDESAIQKPLYERLSWSKAVRCVEGVDDNKEIFR